MRALITGGGGFAGRHLASHLLDSGDEVCLTGRKPDLTGFGPDLSKAKIANLDICDPARWRAVLDEFAPVVIYHLAAITFVPDVDRDRGRAFDTNVGGTLRLFDAAAARKPAPRVVLVSTGHLYAPSTAPIPESAPVENHSFYGMTKRHAEEIARYFASRGISTIIARPFNHSGPGQSAQFVLPSFARQIAEIEAGRGPAKLHVGNLQPVRDFLDVRDVVRAYRLLASMQTQGNGGETFNIASGSGRSIRSVLDALLAKAKIPIGVEVDSSLVRAQDAQAIVGDASKLRSRTGWMPQIPFERTLDEILAEARAYVAQN